MQFPNKLFKVAQFILWVVISVIADMIFMRFIGENPKPIDAALAFVVTPPFLFVFWRLTHRRTR